MCYGETTVPAGKARDEIKKVKNTLSLRLVLKRFWANITCSDIDFGQPEVNICPKCFDLEIDNKWQETPQPQRTSIGSKIYSGIYSGAIIINVHLKRCDFCRFMKNEIKKKRKNLYKDSITDINCPPISRNKLVINPY